MPFVNCGAITDFLGIGPPKDLRGAFIGTAGNVYEDPDFVEADRRRLAHLRLEMVDADVSRLSAS